MKILVRSRGWELYLGKINVEDRASIVGLDDWDLTDWLDDNSDGKLTWPAMPVAESEILVGEEEFALKNLPDKLKKFSPKNWRELIDCEDTEAAVVWGHDYALTTEFTFDEDGPFDVGKLKINCMPLDLLGTETLCIESLTYDGQEAANREDDGSPKSGYEPVMIQLPGASGLTKLD